MQKAVVRFYPRELLLMNGRVWHFATLSVVLACGTPSSSAAQVALIEKALANVEDLGIYYIYGGFIPRSLTLTTGSPREPANQTGYDGFGFELSISVGSIPGASRACRPDEVPKATLDTLDQYTETRESDGKTTRTDYLKTRTKEAAPCHKPDRASLQVAIGYSQIGGFAARDTSLDLRTALRELPSIAFYVALNPEDKISPYFGIRAGIVQLHSLRAYDSTTTASGTVYAGGGSTFQAGGAAGVVAEIGPVKLFLEPSYHIRKINSVEWTPVSNMIPRRLPRELNFSGWQVAIGVEFSIKPQT